MNEDIEKEIQSIRDAKPYYRNSLTWPFGCKRFLPTSREGEEEENTVFLQISKDDSLILKVNPFENLEFVRAAIFESSPGIFYERPAERIIIIDDAGRVLYNFRPAIKSEANDMVEEGLEDKEDNRGILKSEVQRRTERVPSCDRFPPNFRDPEEEIEDRILNRREMAHLFQWYYPEGGWGIVILIATVISQILSQGLFLGIGFPLSLKLSSKFENIHSFHIGCLASISMTVTNLSSLLIIAFCRKKSTRLTAVFGGLILTLGCLFTSFITQFFQLFFSYGTVIAIGVGMIRDSSTVMIGQYFKKNREIVEIFFIGSTGLGVSLMSSFINAMIEKYDWRIGLQIVTGIILSTFILGTFFRSASLYHPQRRAILHLKSRKVLKERCKVLTETHPYFDFSTFRKSRTVQIFITSAAFGSAGFFTPIVMFAYDALEDGFSLQEILLFQVNLGLGWSVGSVMLGLVVYNTSEECIIPRQYLCQFCLLVGSITTMIYASTVKASSGYYVFVWIYGISIGGFQYSIKVALFQKVRSRNFSQTWAILQFAQAVPMGIGVTSASYLNWEYGNKSGYYLSGCFLLLGFLSMCLISRRKNVLSKCKSHKTLEKRINGILRTNEEDDTRCNGDVLPCENILSSRPRQTFQETNYFHQPDENYEEEKDKYPGDNILSPKIIDELANLNEITSCSKVEKDLVISEFQQNILKSSKNFDLSEAIVTTNGTKLSVKEGTPSLLPFLYGKLFTKSNSLDCSART